MWHEWPITVHRCPELHIRAPLMMDANLANIFFEYGRTWVRLPSKVGRYLNKLPASSLILWVLDFSWFLRCLDRQKSSLRSSDVPLFGEWSYGLWWLAFLRLRVRFLWYYGLPRTDKTVDFVCLLTLSWGTSQNRLEEHSMLPFLRLTIADFCLRPVRFRV